MVAKVTLPEVWVLQTCVSRVIQVFKGHIISPYLSGKLCDYDFITPNKSQAPANFYRNMEEPDLRYVKISLKNFSFLVVFEVFRKPVLCHYMTDKQNRCRQPGNVCNLSLHLFLGNSKDLAKNMSLFYNNFLFLVRSSTNIYID